MPREPHRPLYLYLSTATALLRSSPLYPDLPLFDVMTLDDLLASSDERVGLRVFGSMFVAFAAIALLLATVGLYAVTAYAAAQRGREIGCASRSGRSRGEIVAWYTPFGMTARHRLSIGMVGAAGIGQLLERMLIGTDAIDPVTLLSVAGLLVTVGSPPVSCLPAAPCASIRWPRSATMMPPCGGAPAAPQRPGATPRG